MKLNTIAIGGYLQERRKKLSITQSELGERLGVTAQSVSNWERGETLPDTAILPDLARILNTSVDEMLGGGSCAWVHRRRVTVERMREAILCVERLREILGSDHFMYRTMVDALDKRMNSAVEPAFGNDVIMDAYTCEALLECVRNGDYVDIDDVRAHVASQKPREWTLRRLREMGLS